MSDPQVIQLKRIAATMHDVAITCEDQNQAICDVLVLIQAALTAVCKQQADIEAAKTALTQAEQRLQQIKNQP